MAGLKRISQRIAGRRSAVDCWGLVSPDLDDSDFHFREAFIDELKELCGLAAREHVREREEQQPIGRLGATEMPFGAHQGKSLDETPLEYLDWLARSQEDFYKTLRAYLKHPELKSRRSAEIPEDWL